MRKLLFATHELLSVDVPTWL